MTRWTQSIVLGIMALAVASVAACERPIGRPPPGRDAAHPSGSPASARDSGLPTGDHRRLAQCDDDEDPVRTMPIKPAPILVGPGSCSYPANILIVSFKAGTTREQLDRIAKGEGGRLVRVHCHVVQQAVMELPTTTREQLLAAMRRLKAHPELEGSMPNLRCGHQH